MLYMIISSYFHKCSCKSRALEENLFLYYKEIHKDRQVDKERQIIRVSEGILKDSMSKISEMNAEAVIYRTNGLYVIDFYTGFERIVATVNENGQYEICLDEDESVA